MWCHFLVCSLIKGDNKKTTFALIGLVNLLFILLIVFKFSLISLIFMFLFFISIVGTALNLLYKATSDQSYLYVADVA